MRHVFVVNPISGKADASGTLVPRIIEAAKALGAEYSIHLTEYPRHADRLARKEAEKGDEVRLYACGGDGTLNEVLLGAMGFANAAVGCVPCGSGNDFVRNFGGSEPFLDLADLMQGFAVPIDLIDTGHGIAAAICAAGLDAQVAYGIPRFRRIPLCGGSMAYNLSIVSSICGKLGHKLRIRADGEVFTGEFLMLAICNGTSYGGGFKAAPQARMDDGLLDLVMVRKIGRVQIAKVIGVYKNGGHMQNGRVLPQFESLIQHRQVRHVSLETLDGRPIIVTEDGECAPRNALDVRVVPGAGRILLPRSLENTAFPTLSHKVGSAL